MATFTGMMAGATTAMTARTTVQPLQLVVSVAVIAAALLAVGVYLFGWGRNVPTSTSLVTIGEPFTLTTHASEKLSDADLKGTPFAVFFGFTHCPEFCPQGDVGDRALLRRHGAEWHLILCSGDTLKEAKLLQLFGLNAEEAESLVKAIVDAETQLDPALVAKFSTFDGIVMINKDGRHPPVGGHGHDGKNKS
jgi:hypothetical protein